MANPTNARWLPILLASGMAFGAIAADRASAPARAFPDFDEARATPLLVVADLRPAGRLEHPDPACRPEAQARQRAEGKFVWCLHEAYLLAADIRMSVYGQAPNARLEVAMTSHYGTDMYAGDQGPYLALLGRDGGATVLATYANGRVFQNRLGDWILPLQARAPRWLPCEAAGLASTLSEGDFAALQWRAMGWQLGEGDAVPEGYHAEGTRAWPTRGLSIRRLAAFLADRRPGYAAMRCDDPAG